MQPGSLLSISGSAELTDTYRRGGIPAPLALQRNVPEECIAVRALPPDQQRPRHVSDTSARWARRSQMGVALSLRFRDRLGPPAGIEFQWAAAWQQRCAATRSAAVKKETELSPWST